MMAKLESSGGCWKRLTLAGHRCPGSELRRSPLQRARDAPTGSQWLCGGRGTTREGEPRARARLQPGFGAKGSHPLCTISPGLPGRSSLGRGQHQPWGQSPSAEGVEEGSCP